MIMPTLIDTCAACHHRAKPRTARACATWSTHTASSTNTATATACDGISGIDMAA